MSVARGDLLVAYSGIAPIRGKGSTRSAALWGIKASTIEFSGELTGQRGEKRSKSPTLGVLFFSLAGFAAHNRSNPFPISHPSLLLTPICQNSMRESGRGNRRLAGAFEAWVLCKRNGQRKCQKCQSACQVGDEVELVNVRPTAGMTP